MLEGLKPVFSSILRPVMRGLSRLGLNPNAITLIGLAFFIGSGYATAVDKWNIALVLIIIGACFDGLDGLMARDMNLKSTFGAILDSTVDRLTEIVWFLGLLFYYLRTSEHSNMVGPVSACFAALTGSIMVSYVKARCEGAGLSCRPGILQRPERIVLICVFLLIGSSAMFWGVVAMAALTWLTVLQRLVVAWKSTRSHESDGAHRPGNHGPK